MASTVQSPSAAAGLDPGDVRLWRRSWDEVMGHFLPGWQGFEAAMAETVESVLGGPPAGVLDLGGGPGVLAERLVARWPDAVVGLLDLDPVLLRLAEAGAPDAVHVHPGDLSTSGWRSAVARYCPVDLVVVVMTMHYLPADAAWALYRDARAVLRPGGLLVVADLMPHDDLPSVMGALRPDADEAAGLAWTRWWDEIAAEPALRSSLRRRRALFAGRPPAEFVPAERWHRAAARAAGFHESGVVWRCGAHAAICAVA